MSLSLSLFCFFFIPVIGGEEIDLFCKEELQVAEGSDDGENDDPLHLALKELKANPARRSVVDTISQQRDPESRLSDLRSHTDQDGKNAQKAQEEAVAGQAKSNRGHVTAPPLQVVTVCTTPSGQRTVSRRKKKKPPSKRSRKKRLTNLDPHAWPVNATQPFLVLRPPFPRQQVPSGLSGQQETITSHARACWFATAQTPCTTAILHTLPSATNGTNVEHAYTYATSTCQMSSCQNQN